MFVPRDHKRLILGIVGAFLAVGLVVGAIMHVWQVNGTHSFSVVSAGVAGSPPIYYGEGGNAMVTDSAMAPQDMPSYDADTAKGREVYDDYMPMPPYQPTAGATAAEVDQKIIKNGTLRLTVDHVDAAVDGITAIAARNKGFVQSSSTSERGDGKRDGFIVIRVPASDFESAMHDAKALAKIVNNETSNGQDVTEQFSDLQAQLRNAQAQEEEYLRILKKAVSVQDILQVQAQLGNIRSQIESFQGRIKYLENVTSYSTIQVQLSEEATLNLPTKEFRPLTVIKQAAQALIELGQSIVIAVIWIVIVGGGIAIPVALIVALIVTLRRRKR